MFSENAVAIAQQIARCTFPREGFAQLLSRPLRRRVGRDREMHDAPPVV